MGISPIIYDPSLLGFPDFPTTNQQVFSNPTTGTNFTVPSGVTWIGVKCWAAGGGAAGPDGGAGAYAEILLEVYSGEILEIRVGGGGLPGNNTGNGGGSGGINGGGIGGGDIGFGSSNAAGGGGYSGIFVNNRPILMTGGGGGAGWSTAGNSGGSNSYNGANDNYQGSHGFSGETAGGGGGGGFRGGFSAGADNSAGSGLSCAVLRDNMRNLIARRVKVFFIFSNGSPNPNGYLGYGDGGVGRAKGDDGRIEITY
jgi:hypothetical protein